MDKTEVTNAQFEAFVKATGYKTIAEREPTAEDFHGKVKVGKLDIDASPDITAKYSVRSVPTVIVFKGGKKDGQHVGLTNREKLLKLIGVG